MCYGEGFKKLKEIKMEVTTGEISFKVSDNVVNLSFILPQKTD
jgi:hypothetical protein